MASAQSASLRYTPGFAKPAPAPAPANPIVFTTPATLPAVAPLPGDASLPGYTSRSILAGELAPAASQHDINLAGLHNSTQQALAGYSGYKFGDDPSTPEHEDANHLYFDAGAGLGERDKLAIKGVNNAANAGGMLYSSFTNQNIGQAIQQLSLEAQRIATQYASAVNAENTSYGNNVASITSQWAGLYGSDSAWAIEHPPPTPDPTASLPKAADGSPIISQGPDFPDVQAIQNRYPGYQIGVRRAGDGSYIAVIGPGSAPKPTISPTTTYADFLHGRPSSKALAKEWRTKTGQL